MQPTFSIFRALRQTGARLGQDAFVCRRCMQSQSSQTVTASRQSSTVFKSMRQTPFLQAFRSRAPQSSQKSIRYSSTAGASTSHPLAHEITKKAFFPETTSKSVAYWLLGSAASVFGIVVFGGLTRLTESGCASLLQLIAIGSIH